MAASSESLDVSRGVGLVLDTAYVAATLAVACRYIGWPLAHAYAVDEGGVAVPLDTWHAEDDVRFEPFIAQTRAATFKPGAGLVGRVVESGLPEWREDVSTDPEFARAQAAAACGIHSALAVPIISSAGCEGVLEFFTTEVVAGDKAVVDVLSLVGDQLGRVADTERAGLMLAVSESRLHEVQRLAGLGGWRYDVAADHLEWSPALRELYGFDASESPTTFTEYLSRVAPEDLERVRQAITKAIATHTPFEHEYRLVRPSGEVRWAHARGEPSGRDEFVGYCQDVTERRRVTEDLRSSREQLVEAQRIAQMGSWTWDAERNEVIWSPQLYRIYGLDPETSPATFEAYLERVHRDDRERVIGAVMNTRQHLEPFEHEYRIVRPDGEVRHVHARGEILESADGVALRLSGYCHDITDRKVAEEEVAALEARRREVEGKLREVEETKTALLMSVSHEIRTPLTVIIGVAKGLSQGLAGGAEPADELLTMMVRKAEHLQQLLGDVLDVDRLGRGVVAPNPHAVRLPELIERVIAAMESDRVIYADVEDVEAKVDPRFVERILEHLVANALKYTSPESRVWVNARSEDGGVLFAIDDEGEGVPDELKASIFEPFHHGTRIEHSPGTGIGLSLVARLAELQGGRAWVEDRPSGGASFRVSLPTSN